MKNKMLQQGDVLLRPIEVAPKNCKEIKDMRGVVLAEGEATGHYHGIEGCEGVALLEAPDNKRYLVNSTSKTVDLKHQEHKTIPVPPGVFEIDQVREYDYFNEIERRVID